jgi:hypothetical protein
MSSSCSQTDVTFAVAATVLAVFTIHFVIFQFRMGQASGRGGWVKRSEQPRQFKLMMGCWTLLAVIFTLVAILGIYARIHHFPTCR